MKIIRTKKELQRTISARRAHGDKIGFVPTMGALHEGHLSLVKCAQEHADCTVISIFVNPTQFAPHEDFDSYPRTEEEDAAKLEQVGIDILFIPTQDALYPDDMGNTTKAGVAAKGLETDFRPHFFDGVVNVVHRLFEAVKPDVAVFGEKDFQQLQVIKEMTCALNLPIEVIGAPIVRDEHGLALSSRNAYLSDDELSIARRLNIIICEAAKTNNLDTAKQDLLSAGFDKVDYIEKRWDRVLCAVWLGKTRLIDNIACNNT